MQRYAVFLYGLTIIIPFTGLLAATDAIAASEFKILHTFRGGGDGATPWANLIFDGKGRLLGTTEYGGNNGCYSQSYGVGCGTVFSIEQTQSGWSEKILYRFQGGSDGANPRASLVFGPGGNLYSTTSDGGTGGLGTVFSLVPGTWAEQILFSFPAYPEGAYPQSTLAFDQQGNMYGTTANGGNSDAGVVFELSSDRKGGWTETIIDPNGAIFQGGVVMDAGGDLYGTESAGGAYNEGDVYELYPYNSRWKYKVLHSFQGINGSSVLAYAPLIFDRSGNLYGANGSGGMDCSPYPGCGAVYEMASRNGKWRETYLYEFKDMVDGWGPNWGALVFDAGNVYGATEAGGQYGYGSIYKLSPAKGGWKKTTLHSFRGGLGGAYPYGGVTVDQHGNIFGTTHDGGGGKGAHCKKFGCGIVFEIKQ